MDSIYNTLSTRLLALQTALQDLFNILEVGSGSQNFFSPQQRANSQQFASRVLNEVNAVQLIMSRIKGFNMFTPPQAQGLSSIVADISALDQFIDGIVTTIGGNIVGQQIADVIQTYQRPMKLLLQFLTGASNNYQSIEANPKSVEARGAGRMRGGLTYGEQMSGLAKMAMDNPETTMAILKMGMSGGAIVPAYNGEGRFGSDGYKVGDFYSYSDPRRFY